MRTEKPTHRQEFNAAGSGGPGKPRQAPKRMKLNRRFMFNSLQKTILENEFAVSPSILLNLRKRPVL